MLHLPNEMLFKAFQSLPHADYYALSLVNRSIHTLVEPLLYSSVQFDPHNGKKLQSFASTVFDRRPDLKAHPRYLGFAGDPPQDYTPQHARELVDMVLRFISSLPHVTTFVVDSVGLNEFEYDDLAENLLRDPKLLSNISVMSLACRLKERNFASLCRLQNLEEITLLSSSVPKPSSALMSELHLAEALRVTSRVRKFHSRSWSTLQSLEDLHFWLPNIECLEIWWATGHEEWLSRIMNYLEPYRMQLTRLCIEYYRISDDDPLVNPSSAEVIDFSEFTSLRDLTFRVELLMKRAAPLFPAWSPQVFDLESPAHILIPQVEADTHAYKRLPRSLENLRLGFVEDESTIDQQYSLQPFEVALHSLARNKHSHLPHLRNIILAKSDRGRCREKHLQAPPPGLAEVMSAANIIMEWWVE